MIKSIFAGLAVLLVSLYGHADTPEACSLPTDSSVADINDGYLPAPPTDYSCLIHPDQLGLTTIDQIIDLSRIPDASSSLIPDAVKLVEADIAQRRWLRGKRLLLVDDGLDMAERGRICYRLRQQGIHTDAHPVRILVGGVRAYAAYHPVIRHPVMDQWHQLSAANALAAASGGRAQVIPLRDFQSAEGADIDLAALVVTLAAPGDTDLSQFGTQLLLGSEDAYAQLGAIHPLPWWTYLVTGGEQAYVDYAQLHPSMAAAARKGRAQRCDLRY